jgi:hypothetical protein
MKKQKVAVCQYRCGGNFKEEFIVLIPKGKKFKVGDEEVCVSEFGISDEEWYFGTIPGEYDPELDHNLLEILEIRDRKDTDIITNQPNIKL